MTNRITILSALATVIINGIVGHFFAPNGIMFTPLVLIITSSLIAIGTKDIKVIWKSILIFSFVALNDILIKLYAGGSHDPEGLAWIQLLMFVGLLPTFAILVTTIFRDKTETISNKILATLIFPILVGLHLYLFSDLGLGRHYSY